MLAKFYSLFLAHPRAVGETYLQHTAFALWFAGQLFLAGGAALVHAILPFAFERTASTIVGQLHERTHDRGS